MLKSIKRVTQEISGLKLIGYSERAERGWIKERENRHSVKFVASKKRCDKTGFLGVNSQKTGGIIERPHPYPSGCEIGL